MFYRTSSIYYIFSDRSSYFTSFSGIISVLCILFTESIIDLFIITYSTVHIVFSMVYICFTVICFIQLKYVNNLLQCSKIISSDLIQFTRHHTDMLSYVFDINNFSEDILTAFMFGQLPVNTYLMIRIVMKTFSPETSVIFFNFALMQFTVLGIFVFCFYCFYSNNFSF